MSIRNRTDVRDLIINNEIETAKQLGKIWECGLDQQSIMVKLVDNTSIEIYNKFLGVIYILCPGENILRPEEDFLHYHLLLRQLVCKMFQEKYSINNNCTEETMRKKSNFLTEDVPKYVTSVPVLVSLPHIFLENLWDCLRQCNIDDERISIAWLAAINFPN